MNADSTATAGPASLAPLGIPTWSKKKASIWLIAIVAILGGISIWGRQRRDRVLPLDRADADRHPGLDRARPHGADVPVPADVGAGRVGRAEAVHRHREVRDHGDPVLHPGRQLPHARGRGAADDPLRDDAGRPLPRRPRARGHHRLRDVRSGVRVVGGDGRGDRLDPAAGDGQAGLSDALRRRRHHHRGLARHPDAAVDPEGDLRDLDQHVDRRALRGGTSSPACC